MSCGGADYLVSAYCLVTHTVHSKAHLRTTVTLLFVRCYTVGACHARSMPSIGLVSLLFR